MLFSKPWELRSKLNGRMLSIEALYIGLPAVLLLCEDIRAVKGKDFTEDSICDFEDDILRYSVDGQYYETQSKKAYNRG